MIPIERPENYYQVESHALIAIKIARSDGQNLRYKFTSWFNNEPNPHNELEHVLNFSAQADLIQATIEKSQLSAPLESSALRARYMFIMSRRNVLFEKAYTISLLPWDKRWDAWASLSSLLSDLKTEIHLVPVEAEICNKFIARLQKPEDRYRELRKLVHQELQRTQSLVLSDEKLRGQRRRLQHFSEGLLGPSDMTLFDVLRASERIRQGRMDIEEYKIKGK